MSKLTDSPKLQGSLVHAWTEPCARKIEVLDAHGNVTGSDHQDERFKFIVDETGLSGTCCLLSVVVQAAAALPCGCLIRFYPVRAYPDFGGRLL